MSLDCDVGAVGPHLGRGLAVQPPLEHVLARGEAGHLHRVHHRHAAPPARHVPRAQPRLARLTRENI